MSEPASYIDTTFPFMDRMEVCKILMKSKSQLYLDVEAGTIPPPIKIGGRRVVFISKEIEKLISLWVSEVGETDIKKEVLSMILNRK